MPFLVLLFILVPIVELWAIIQVGQLIGTVAHDRAAAARLDPRRVPAAPSGPPVVAALPRDARRPAAIPANETADGALVIFGGALLMTPGFVTDIFGLLMLIPGSRALIRRFALRRAVTIGAASAGGPAVWTIRGMDWGRRGHRAYRARPRRFRRRAARAAGLRRRGHRRRRRPPRASGRPQTGT